MIDLLAAIFGENPVIRLTNVNLGEKTDVNA